MSSEPTVITADTAATRFCTSLRWRVHDPEEALSIAATHRRKAAALQDRGLADQHGLIATICEQHAENLTEAAARSGATRNPPPVAAPLASGPHLQ